MRFPARHLAPTPADVARASAEATRRRAVDANPELALAEPVARRWRWWPAALGIAAALVLFGAT